MSTFARTYVCDPHHRNLPSTEEEKEEQVEEEELRQGKEGTLDEYMHCAPIY